MPKVLVLFHSRTGRTAALAEAIAEGASSVKFAEVELRRLENLAPRAADASAPASRCRALESVESIADYDAIIVGSPSWYGGMSAEVKHVLDQLGPLSGGRPLVDKVGSAFSTANAAQGGEETTVQSILVAMMHQGMLIVPPAYGEDVAAARSHGARVAKVAEWVRHAKSHEHGHKH
ncbi:MAG: NAD(P)H:quinone oxidoreductase [Gemmatimonadaceae bacterium]|nr:NAD(P)H:quinone oxidoreductase [Gemmatimonadaceae bacterium]NUQ94860.1 NAD(P)H:quinone oxidoreductase [Gemmatimonadaceae bacterium]NUR19695.1 NAD(P)H:quinone oxidoreductase [Gemmatimonadaceae bacterium]NUS96115.1 NAD(P)H:quinone oxidoreductase [Gemmatimonadaceae bacterium]